MTNDGLRSPRGLISAAILAIAGVLLGWLCFRYLLVQALSAAPGVMQLTGHNPDIVLDRAETALLERHGILDAKMLGDVRQAALASPLDARAFLILGHQQLLDGQPGRAVRTLEAGQRLDPRQRVIHLLLLDRYVRTGRMVDATMQFSVLAKLGAGEQIAAALAKMSSAPDTRDAVRQALHANPSLERVVLIKLANATTEPAAIFALASPTALRQAGDNGGWGPALVNRLVQQGEYALARATWQRIYRLSAAQVAAPLFNAGLQPLAAVAPFNWSLASGGIGAVDMRNNALSIEYYGRDSGELAGQILVLRPGAYRFAFKVDGGKAGTGPVLLWSLRCASGDKTELMRAVVSGGRPAVTAGLTVPPGCPAQQLALIGEAGDFPATIDLTISNLDLRPAAGAPR